MVASDARGSRTNSESGASDPASRARFHGTGRGPELYFPQTDSRGGPWEASDWPSLRKATQPWLFGFWNSFWLTYPACTHPITPLFLRMQLTCPNSTCSRADYLCMIGFAYRAADARSQMSQARRISRESIGFFCRVRTCWPK